MAFSLIHKLVYVLVLYSCFEPKHIATEASPVNTTDTSPLTNVTVPSWGPGEGISPPTVAPVTRATTAQASIEEPGSLSNSRRELLAKFGVTLTDVGLGYDFVTSWSQVLVIDSPLSINMTDLVASVQCSMLFNAMPANRLHSLH